MSRTTSVKVIMIVGWVATQAFFYYNYGGKIAVDTHRFLRFTNDMLNGDPISDFHVWRYLGYPLFLLPFFKIGLSLKYVALVQILISGVASLLFYKAVKEIVRQEAIALFATTLLIFNADLQAFNCYILTDSLFTSLFTISICLMLIPKTKMLWACFGAAVIWTVLLRPNGFIILLAIAAYVLTRYKPLSKYNKWAVGGIGLFLTVGFYFILDRVVLETFTLMIPYERGDLIYEYTGIVLNKFHQPQIPPVTLTPLSQLAWFIWVNPLYFIAIALLKGLAFFIHAKPYYSLAHNIAILGMLLPVYVLSWIGWYRSHLTSPVRALLLTPILLQAGITMLTIEDWDGRWLYPILPIIYLFASLGLLSLLKRTRFAHEHHTIRQNR